MHRPLFVLFLSFPLVVSAPVLAGDSAAESLIQIEDHRILFLDDADALLARGAADSPADLADSQQAALVLHRLEQYPGLVILASQQDIQLDAVLARRLQAIIRFPRPDGDQRLRLWRDHFQDQPFSLADDVDLAALSMDHDLTGGSIANVLRTAALQAVRRDPAEVTGADLEWAIRRELQRSSGGGGGPV